MSGLLPQYEFLGKGAPPKSLEAWKGLRVRAGGGIGDAMSRLGAILSTVPATEVYTAIERGTVDAVSFPYTYAHAAYQIHTVANWYTANMSPGTSECAAVINRDALRQAAAAVQAAAGRGQGAGLRGPDQRLCRDRQGQPADVQVEADRDRLLGCRAARSSRTRSGRPVWDKWVADNKGKFDSQNVLDTLLREIEKAQAKHLKK